MLVLVAHHVSIITAVKAMTAFEVIIAAVSEIVVAIAAITQNWCI